MLSSHTKFNPLEIIVVGPSSSGKTNLITAHICQVEKKFNPTHRPTIGVDFLTTRLELGNQESTCVRIWDTAHPLFTGNFADKYIEGRADLYILCMDLSDPYATFNLEKIINAYELDASRKSTHGMLLVGTKSDKERAFIDLASFIVKLEKFGTVRYVETSAKEFANGNIDHCFQIAKEMMASSAKIALSKPKQPDASKKNETIKTSIATQSFLSKPCHSVTETAEPSPNQKSAPAKEEGLHLVLRLRK